MSDTHPKDTATPARRRNPRNGGKRHSHKNQTIDSDASLTALVPDGSPLPRTPQKAAGISADMQNPSTQRAKNKNRPAYTPSSPEFARSNQKTPPQGTVPKSAAQAAFAGATFHNSPAPSELPKPSFCKVPPISPQNKLYASPTLSESAVPNQQPTSPPLPLYAPSPQHPASMPQARESPLEFMFKAHRQETEKSRLGRTQESPQGYSQPRAAASPLGGNLTDETWEARLSAPRQSTGIPAWELDGTPGQPIGESFSTPFNERIRAARANRQPPARQSLGRGEHSTEKSEALKEFLFSTPPRKPVQSGQTPPAITKPGNFAFANNTPANPRSQGHGQRDAEVLAMEDNLRRILKLEPTSGAQ